MLFSSITFLYIFLPILLVLYFLARKPFWNTILLIASLLFYSFGEPKWVTIMLGVIIINYLGGLLLDKARVGIERKIILFVFVVVNLGILINFKYWGFFLENINAIFSTRFCVSNIVMPIGISFYIFQSLSYIIDVYRQVVKAEKNFFKLALYISLFPQLIAGPIIKYHDIEPQISNRDLKFDNVVFGIKRFIIGLSKKVILANTLGLIVDKIYIQSPDSFSCAIAWLGALCYALQLFFDFSGYSDMAIGLGQIFGFKFIENFNYPYISKSMSEFWHRWHISLSNWFKDYVYIPLGGNRHGLIKQLRNLSIVFLLTGLWHGAAINFVVWGIWNGLFIIIEKIIKVGQKDKSKENQSLFITIFRHIYVVLVFLIGFVVFRSEDMNYAVSYLKNMFLICIPKEELYPLAYYVERYEFVIIIISIICCTPIFSKMLQKSEKNNISRFFVNVYLIILFLYSTILILSSSYNPFIYFRF